MAENLDNLAARLTELETHLAFQEQTIEELHEVIYRQQGQLDALAREMSKLNKRLEDDHTGGKSGGGSHG